MSSESGSGGLRRMHAGDLDRVLAWRNHPEVRRYMYTQHVIGRDEHQAWFERAHADPSKHLLVFEREGQPGGFVNVTIVDEIARRAEWGFYLAPDARRGSGSRLGEQTLAYVFGDLKLHKLCGEALAYNERSVRFHERLGFRQEARLRDHHFDGSRYHDVIGFGLLAAEWLRGSGSEVR
ncbi:UDP-4-amino-4,6-dideoxy-N-acetyl-beta-L-altrosamine N-acetyltransferase [Guyparkeria sp. SB14A]|uniref:UDP-4-amino-4, 6-dideoxy-N-acetyl-beta-L-altrosamine N-acetyltransferase n=2 Tax=Guyparkeria TaxID=2035712 RepID=UPI001B7FB198|nr:UDP-4-amino-4,6-dideoxy-N-acetyl-beta-L-altrosamine N-acetyltransferase [Guyparkeria sp. SB14A]